MRTSNEPAASDEVLVQRALAAYFRAAARGGIHSPDQPSSGSDVEEVDGKRYVVLRGGKGAVLGVYRVRNNGALKGMKRPPKELTEERLARQMAGAGREAGL